MRSVDEDPCGRVDEEPVQVVLPLPEHVAEHVHFPGIIVVDEVHVAEPDELLHEAPERIVAALRDGLPGLAHLLLVLVVLVVQGHEPRVLEQVSDDLEALRIVLDDVLRLAVGGGVALALRLVVHPEQLVHFPDRGDVGLAQPGLRLLDPGLDAADVLGPVDRRIAPGVAAAQHLPDLRQRLPGVLRGERPLDAASPVPQLEPRRPGQPIGSLPVDHGHEAFSVCHCRQTSFPEFRCSTAPLQAGPLPKRPCRCCCTTMLCRSAPERIGSYFLTFRSLKSFSAFWRASIAGILFR